MGNFEWTNETIGKSRNLIRRFEDIKFLKEIYKEDIFTIPEGAIIEKL